MNKALMTFLATYTCQDGEFLAYADSVFVAVGVSMSDIKAAAQGGNQVALYQAGEQLQSTASNANTGSYYYTISKDMKPIQEHFRETMTEYSLIGNAVKSAAENIDQRDTNGAEEDIQYAVYLMDQARTYTGTYENMIASYRGA